MTNKCNMKLYKTNNGQNKIIDNDCMKRYQDPVKCQI